MGMRLKYSNPMYMDDVAAISLICGSFWRTLLPWQEEALSVRPTSQRLHRPLRLVAEIFSADPGPLHQLDPAGQDAVRLGLAGDHPGPLAGRFRQTRHPRRDRPKVLKANARKLLGFEAVAACLPLPLAAEAASTVSPHPVFFGIDIVVRSLGCSLMRFSLVAAPCLIENAHVAGIGEQPPRRRPETSPTMPSFSKLAMAFITVGWVTFNFLLAGTILIIGWR